MAAATLGERMWAVTRYVRDDFSVSRIFQITRQRSFNSRTGISVCGREPDDRWCLCAPRWQEAFEAGQAPRVVLRATREGARPTARSPISNASQWTWRDRGQASRDLARHRVTATCRRRVTTEPTIVKTLLNNLRTHIGYEDDGRLVHTDKKTGVQRVASRHGLIW